MHTDHRSLRRDGPQREARRGERATLPMREAPRAHPHDGHRGSPCDAPARALVARQLRLRLVLRSLAHEPVLALANVATGTNGWVDLEHVRVRCLAPAQNDRTHTRCAGGYGGGRYDGAAAAPEMRRGAGRRREEGGGSPRRQRDATHFICCAIAFEEARFKSQCRCSRLLPPKDARSPVVSPSRLRRSACLALAGLNCSRAVARPVGTMRCCGSGRNEARCDESHSHDGA